MEFTPRLLSAASGEKSRPFASPSRFSAETRRLTPREIEVLTWVARGKSAREIGKILDISKRTADAHAHSAGQKIGAVNRTQAVAIAVRDRLIEI
jgi:DNA-binding CsgD family transcriptional regulator